MRFPSLHRLKNLTPSTPRNLCAVTNTQLVILYHPVLLLIAHGHDDTRDRIISEHTFLVFLNPSRFLLLSDDDNFITISFMRVS